MLHTGINGETPDREGEMLTLVTINGTPHWQSQTGRTFPQVAGAEDPPADTNDGDDQSGDGDSEFDKDRALSTIRKLRDKEREQRAQLKELEALKVEKRQREEAEKSEAERLKEQIAESERKAAALERELQDARTRQTIERVASKAGAADPEDVYKLLKSESFEFDDDGNLTNVETLVKDLLKDKPYLTGKQSGGTSAVPATPRSTGQPGRGDKVREAEEKLIATRLYNPIG